MENEILTLDEARAVLADMEASIRDEIHGYKTVDEIPAELLQRSLEYVVAQAVYVAHIETTWRTTFPLDTDMPAGAVTKKYTIWDGVAMAAWYVEGSKHPNVAIGSRSFTISFEPFSLAYTLNVLSLMAAEYAGLGEEAQKAARVTEGHDEFFENLFFLGDSVKNMDGLVDHTNITAGDFATGDWNHTGTTTAANIIADVKAIFETIILANSGNPKFRGNFIDIVCAPQMAFILRTMTANEYTRESIEAVLRRELAGYFGRIIDCPILATSDGGAGDLVFFGPFSDANSICAPVSMDTVRMPQDNRGMEIEQPFVSKAGPLHVKEPLFFYQGEGALYTP